MIRNLKNGLIALALCSVTFSLAQNGNGNNGGGDYIDACDFGKNVHLIGEKNPEAGVVQTYTLQNADATERKIWRVDGAYEIDGQLTATNGNEVIKPGNSIDVIWEDNKPNGKIIVRKELPCQAQQRKPEIIFPVQPVLGIKKNCHETITATNDYACPISPVDYYYDGPACTNNQFHWGFKGAYRYSFNGGLTWNYGCKGWCGADGTRTITIEWFDIDDAVLNCKPTGTNECCDSWLFGPANRTAQRTVFIQGANAQSAEDAVVNASGNIFSIYRYIPFSTSSTKICGNTTGSNSVPIYCMDFTIPFMGNVSSISWNTDIPYAYLVYGSTGKTGSNRENQIYLTYFSDTDNGNVNCTVTFNNGCTRVFAFAINGINSNPCTGVSSIQGDDIECTNPNKNMVFTANGGNNAQTFYWTIPATWSTTATPRGAGFTTTSNSINVVTYGNEGNITVTPENYSLCLNSYQPFTVTQSVGTVNLSAPEINAPLCAESGDIPDYRVTNAQSGLKYNWFYNSDPNPFGESSGGQLVHLHPITGYIPFTSSTSFSLRVEATSKATNCHNIDEKTHTVSLRRWTTPNDQIAWNECEPAPVAIIANPDNGGILNTVVDENQYGTELSYEEYLQSIGQENNTSENVKEEEIKAFSGTLTEVYPNPANVKIIVRSEYTSYKLLNLQGNVLSEGVLNNKNAEVNTSNLPAGLYLVELSKENAKFVRKIQIVH